MPLRCVTGAVRSTGRRTMNSLPWPAPLLRTSTLPPCISTSCLTSERPIPSPPSERSRFRSIWVYISKIFGQHVAGNFDTGVLDGHHRIASLPLDGQRDATSSFGIIGGIIQQV